MRRSFKYRIYPNKIQRERLEHSLDLLRTFYNAALQERKQAWELNRVRVSCFDQINQIPEIRNSLNTDYQAITSNTLSQTLRKLDKAFQAFFRRVKAGEKPGYPRFKGKAFFNSIIYNGSGYRFKNDKLNMSRIGDIKIKLSRPVEGRIKEVVLKREGSKWFAVLSCNNVPANHVALTDKQVGIDVGIEHFATLSDGTQVANPRCYESAQKALRIAQRRVARRKKGSACRRKAVAILRNIHAKLTNQRRDFQHKISTHLIRHNDLIAVENLNSVGLARGILSKQVLDASWSSFFHMLSYKAENAGRRLVKVDPRNTSQTCTCGERVEKKLSVRWHKCSSCGYENHRDIVSAQIILSRAVGLTVQPLT